jgi:hypothetical protein
MSSLASLRRRIAQSNVSQIEPIFVALEREYSPGPKCLASIFRGRFDVINDDDIDRTFLRFES